MPRCPHCNIFVSRWLDSHLRICSQRAFFLQNTTTNPRDHVSIESPLILHDDLDTLPISPPPSFQPTPPATPAVSDQVLTRLPNLTEANSHLDGPDPWEESLDQYPITFPLSVTDSLGTFLRSPNAPQITSSIPPITTDISLPATTTETAARPQSLANGDTCQR